jgi:hypothetical protein
MSGSECKPGRAQPSSMSGCEYKRGRSAIALAITIAVLATPALATTVTKLSLEQLVQRADLIVQGQVQSVSSQWDQQRRLVFTYVSIRVDEPLKGERRQSVLIRQIGGSVGTIEMSVAGAAQFKTGQKALVFLKRQDATTFQVVGMNQGVYRIVEDSAVSNVSGMDLLDSKTGEIAKPLIDIRAPLEQLKTKIRELLR